MIINRGSDNNSYELYSPTILPKASGFLWNESMMINMNCRGYAVAQFMQPEPSKYSHAPNLEAKTFMQPEQPYYANHPGRFFYIKDEDSGELFSLPYEPVRAKVDSYKFIVGKDSLSWLIEHDGLSIKMILTLPKADSLEMWSISVKNSTNKPKNISIYPYFSVGYMSWLNQSGEYNEELQSIVCSSITPYQKYEEYEKIKTLKDKTFLIPDTTPYSWEVNQYAFEGEGGLNNPDGILEKKLNKGCAKYETPACVFQYKVKLTDEEYNLRFLFGPAKDEYEISELKKKYFLDLDKNGLDGFSLAKEEYQKYISEGTGTISIKTPDDKFDDFINNWLPRQMYYHGITNRLTTDPQTRNYLQDNMGMAYIKPELSRNSIILSLSQQASNGEMPDGILLEDGAELKYINQIPHTDHCVWLPVCISAYLDETDDYEILDEMLPFSDSEDKKSVLEHISLAMDWLVKTQDHRGLNFINQGDWCDPMNMVGYKGRGVSGWLTIAAAYAFKIWAEICEVKNESELSSKYNKQAEINNSAVNKYFWDGEWYARGITDDNVVFGTSKDKEGKIFINPQGWALLSGAADDEKKEKLIKSVEDELETPYGAEMFSPAFTSMREDVGRVTQKYPGTAENGSIYNHATTFYIYGLYNVNKADNAFRLLKKMISGDTEKDTLIRGQLPTFIPNYYRGAYKQNPDYAGKSSQLFNTGTVQWYYRCVIDGLFGLKGCRDGLKVEPQLPSTWDNADVIRNFRGSKLNIKFAKEDVKTMEIFLNDTLIQGNIIKNLKPDNNYKVTVKLPK